MRRISAVCVLSGISAGGEAVEEHAVVGGHQECAGVAESVLEALQCVMEFADAAAAGDGFIEHGAGGAGVGS
jgi:hypothetical protein